MLATSIAIPITYNSRSGLTGLCFSGSSPVKKSKLIDYTQSKSWME